MPQLANKYEQVADWLTGQIESGQYPKGGYIPSERVLSTRLSASRVTVRQGLELLKQRGVIVAEPGKGCRVVDPNNQTPRINTYLVAAIMPSITDAYSTGPMSDCIVSTIESSGYHAIFSVTEDRPARELSRLQQVRKRQAAGMILQPSFGSKSSGVGNHERFKRLYDGGFPVVVMDRPFARPGLPCVCNDEEAGGYMATRYMLDRGHRDILFAMSTSLHTAYLRYAGYKRAILEAGCKVRLFDVNLTLKNLGAPNDPESKAVAQNMLKGMKHETAIVTSGFFPFYLDVLTAGWSSKPEWIGYDLGPNAKVGDVLPFPYMKRPMAEIGRRAAEKLLALIAGDTRHATEEFLKPTVVEVDASI